MPSPFVVSRTYTRDDVYEILAVPEGQRRGNWETGYTRWIDDLYVFSTVGAPATGGYDYDNGWEGDVFRWYAKGGTRIDQPQIQWMLNDANHVYIFTRPGVRHPFTFEGTATPLSWEDTTPVLVRWMVNRDPPMSPGVTYMLTSNPNKWDWPDYEEVVMRNRASEAINQSWSTGNTRSMEPGSRVFLLRQAVDRGIIASGRTASDVYMAAHWDGSGRQSPYVNVVFDRVLAVEDVMPIETLLTHADEYNWNRLQASGTSVPPGVAATVERLWRAHLKYLADAELPNEVPHYATYPEGATKRIVVNAYERNPKARAACIDHYTAVCVVCGFAFATVYGAIGEGYIHVHHLRDLATVGAEYEVDPLEDLRPVCPNCHAMLHVERPAMSIEALRTIIMRRRPGDDLSGPT